MKGEISIMGTTISRLESLANDTRPNHVEENCRGKYKEDFIEGILKKATISTKNAFKKAPVLFKGNGDQVPEYVVKCVLALYLEPMIVENKAKIIAAADELVYLFDRDSLTAFLRIVGERVFNKYKPTKYLPSGFSCASQGIEKYDLMIPMLCRLMNEDGVQIFINQYHNNNQYLKNMDFQNPYYKDSEQNINAYNDLLIDGIILSDTNSAIEFCKAQRIIDRYAVLRGKAVSEFDSTGPSDGVVVEDELKLSKAVVIYDEYLKKMDSLMGNSYNYPTVMSHSGIGSISKDNILANAFFEKLFNRYNNSNSETGYFYDYIYKPYELYELWKNNDTLDEGQVGLCFTIGLAVAYYMFESSDIEAEIVYCRDKWEYRGDYSYATRAALHITPDTDNWTVYEKKGYPVRDM